jgi:uncharacterized protein (DUF433 family)
VSRFLRVGMIANILTAGRSAEEILTAYPYLEKEDITAALGYATRGLNLSDGLRLARFK